MIRRTQDSASWHELASAPLVDAARLERAWSMYVPPGCDATPEDVAPEAFADVSGLPPTLVITAEFDPLREEGEAFGQALQRAGVPTVIRRYPGMIHGFVGMSGFLSDARTAIDEVAASLRSSFEALRD